MPQNISTNLKGLKVKYKLHYGRYTVDVRGHFLGLHTVQPPAAVTTNISIKMSSFKSSKTFKRKMVGSDNQSSSVTLINLLH